MKLSYLDILLSTTTIFVVLFGITSLGENLPEEEGKALILLLVAEPPRLRERELTYLEVRYLDERGRSLGPASLPLDALKAGADNGHGLRRKIRQLYLDFSLVAKQGVVVIRGQPEPKSTILVKANAHMKLSDDQKTLLSLNRTGEQFKKQLDTPERELFDWIQDGEGLAFALNTTSTSREGQLQKWLDRCPVRPVSNLWSELAALANDRNIQSRKYTRTRIDLLAHALMVHDGLLPATRRLIPAKPPERPVQEAFSRANRHLEYSWGAAIALTEPLPAWSKAQVFDQKLPGTRWNGIQQPGWAENWQRYCPEGGTFFVEDCVAHDVLLPLRGYWSYAGYNGCRSSGWKLKPGSPDVLEVEWSVTFD